MTTMVDTAFFLGIRPSGRTMMSAAIILRKTLGKLSTPAITPQRHRVADLHSWSWDPVDQEYLLFDSAKTGPRAYAFHMPSRTWTKITNSDFAGIEDRTFISAAGTATDPDHNLIVIVGGSYWGTPIKSYVTSI